MAHNVFWLHGSRVQGNLAALHARDRHVMSLGLQDKVGSCELLQPVHRQIFFSSGLHPGLHACAHFIFKKYAY